MSFGKLYLVPVMLHLNSSVNCISNEVLCTIDKLQLFITEKEKTSRKYIKTLLPNKEQQKLIFFELDKHNPSNYLEQYMEPLFNGNSMGFMSECGSPVIADPGHNVVNYAHNHSIEVVPLSGPSSILLALMASGFHGQKFTFHGYLPKDRKNRTKKLKKIEELSQKNKSAEIFIETPYRNQAMLRDILCVLRSKTNLSLAIDLYLPSQQILSYTIDKWKSNKINIQNRYVVYVLFV